MNKHSHKVLEFNKIKLIISNYAILEETKTKILKITPLKNMYKIKTELEYIQDFMELLKYDGGIELTEIKNILNYKNKISIVGNYLDIEDLFFIGKNLRIFRIIKSKFKELEKKYKNIYNKFKNIPTYKEIEILIESIIDNNRQIKDTASLNIKNIRFNKILIQKNIKQKFDKLISNPNYNNIIQEKLITIRNGRSVIPIKTDFKGQIKGIEHDRSSSGQTVFIEPIEVVSLNNKVKELETKEREEIRKILLKLTDNIRINLSEITKIGKAILDIDELNAKCLYGKKNRCIVPQLNTKEYISLIKARHPLIPQKEVIPLNLDLGNEYNILLITGPNTGGKTAALKTAGLLTIMTLSGIPIPASEKTDIGYFDEVFADIGDEQSIEQNLSSFSAHLKKVNFILHEITKKSLVLLDELGSGTDPIEGSAFAIAVTDYLKEKKCKSIITTHYSEVKAYGYNNSKIETASMEFNLETLAPTFNLRIGMLGESNALTIAKKIGIFPEIIEKAKSYISEEDKKIENMIINIKEQSEELSQKNIKTNKLQKELENQKKEYSEKLINLEKEKQNILEKKYREAEIMMNNMQFKAKALIDKINREENQKEDLKNVQKTLSMLKTSMLEDKKRKIIKKPKTLKKLYFEVGDKVFLKSLKQNAIILYINQKKEQAQVQAGILKMMVSFENIGLLNTNPEKKQIKTFINNVKNSSYKIDIRGQLVEEAINELEIYLNRAILSGYNKIQVIHGKGTGQLRKGVQEYLKISPFVLNFVDANQNEGGLGCTIVKLK